MHQDFSTLFELLPIGAYRSSPDGRQLRANPALVALDGYQSEAEMLAATNDLATEWYVDPGRRDAFKALLARDGRVVDFVSEVYRHKSRERIWVRVHAHEVRDDQGQVLFYEGTVQDITEEHNARLALQASERRFRALTEKAQVLTVICDAQGLVSYVSPAARQLLGRAPEQLVGSHLLDWSYPDDKARALEEFERVLRKEIRSNEVILRLTHADGSPRSVALLASNCLDDDAIGGIVLNGRDVTEAQAIQRQLVESEARFRSLTEMSSDWYWEQDEHYRFVTMSTGTNHPLKVSPDEHIGKTRWELPHVGVDESTWQEHRALLERREPFRDFELGRIGADGTVRVVSSSGIPVFDENGRFRGYRGVARDITLRKEAEREILNLANTDSLTGVMNRRHFMSTAELDVLRASRNGQELSILMLDLDHFKSVNDRHGHASGDQVLCDFVTVIQSCLRDKDAVGRLGGEEFAVLLPHTSLEGARSVAERILQRVRERMVGGADSSLRYTTSIGVASLSEHTPTLHAILRLADQALYQAKHNGRDRVEAVAG